MGVNSLPKTATRQRRGCDLNPGLLRLSPARQPLGYRATPRASSYASLRAAPVSDQWLSAASIEGSDAARTNTRSYRRSIVRRLASPSHSVESVEMRLIAGGLSTLLA